MNHNSSNKQLKIPNYLSTTGKNGNYCVFTNMQQPKLKAKEPGETEKLIDRYRRLKNEINQIRGQLYVLGIDPETYGQKRQNT